MKFRVWCISKELYLPDNAVFITSLGELRFGFEDARLEKPEDPSDYIIEFGSGVKDKNLSEMFIGDILGLPLHLKDENRLSVVEWIDGVFAIDKNSSTDHFLDKDTLKISEECFEVVGNIHQNKELLEGKK